MMRAAAWTLLVAWALTGSLEAQGSGHGFQGRAGGPPGRTGVAGPRGVFNRPFSRGALSRGHFRHDHTGAVLYPGFFPYDGFYGYEQPYPETVASEPEPAPAAPPTQAPQPPPLPSPKIIEVPGAAQAVPAKPLPPVVFILTSGERLEARRFLLKASDLTVTINRHQRTVPLEQLDLDATLAANRERGIDLKIPADPNEISLSF